MNLRECQGRGLELPCVWSLAGVLGMHPCDREYDCDSCELYHALSGRQTPGDLSATRCPHLSQTQRRIETQVGQIVSAVLAGCRLDFARWYGGDGVWAAFDAESGNLDVGLAGCVWRILQPIEEVVAPRSGVSFEAGETCGWLLKSERAIPIRIPVGGTIVELNEGVVEALEDAGQLDGPENWLFRVRSGVTPTESTRLFRGEDALIWQLRRLRILKGHLRRALELEGSDLGILMADGGALETNLEVILGRERYGEMIDALF